MCRTAVAYALSIAITALTAPVVPAVADAGFSCCAELEARVTDLEKTAIRQSARAVALSISGLVTVPIIAWEDGQQGDVYLATNEVRRTRFRLSGEGRINDSWSGGFAAEVGSAPSPFAPVDQLRYDASSGTMEVRLFNWSVKSKEFGQLSMGLVSQASDGITEISLANTGGVVTTGLPLMLGYFERGYFLRRSGGALTDLRFGDLLFRGRTSAWGDGHRFAAVRFDTALMHGVTLSATWGEDHFMDGALRYAVKVGRLHFAAGLAATRWQDDSPADPSGCALDADRRSDCWHLGGSMSVMDTQTGLFANLAAGYYLDRNMDDLYGGASRVDDDEAFVYAVAGIEQRWFDIGPTTLFGQVWHKSIGAGVSYAGGRLDATSVGALPFVAGGEATVFGVSAVQTLAEGVDMYASLNRALTHIETSDTGHDVGARGVSFEPFDFLITGMSVRF